MNNDLPLVSIIMATYNRAHFIVETLLSIQNQTYKNWECLIIDDGGTDNTEEVIQPVLLKDSRFIFNKRPEKYQKGLPGCRNYGIDKAKGNYIIFFDDDDIVHPLNLELCVNELQKSNHSFCRYLRTTFTGEFNYQFDYNITYTKFFIDKSDVMNLIVNKLPFNSCAVMWQKECFLENRFVEHLMYAEEWELYSRILSTGIKGVSIDKVLFFGRKHPNSNTGEFANKNYVRIESKKNAILLIVENLYDKKQLTKPLLRYFVATSLKYKEFNLFSDIKRLIKLSFFEKIYWNIFYVLLPFRIAIIRILKKVK